MRCNNNRGRVHSFKIWKYDNKILVDSEGKMRASDKRNIIEHVNGRDRTSPTLI